MPEISIIIPVYNAAKYISRCIDSILNQSFEDFELIICDDGSKDDSGKIIDEYAAKDPRIIAIHQENKGVSATRNHALSLAKGNYIQFSDSDDWLAPNSCELLYKAIKKNNSDLAIANFYRVVGNRATIKGDIDQNCSLSIKEFADYMIENPADLYYGVLWNKLYKRSIIEENNLRMNEDISWSEDFLFNLDYYVFTKKIQVIDDPVYYYVMRRNSLVYTALDLANVIKMKTELFTYYSNFYEHILDPEEYQKRRLSLYRYYIDYAGDSVMNPIKDNTVRLGKERPTLKTNFSQESVIYDIYTNRLLFSNLIGPLVAKYKLSKIDLAILMFLDEEKHISSRSDLSEILNEMSFNIYRSLVKLQNMNLIAITSIKDEDTGYKETVIKRLPLSDDIYKDLLKVKEEIDDIRFAELTEKEREEYKRLNRKINETVSRRFK